MSFVHQWCGFFAESGNGFGIWKKYFLRFCVSRQVMAMDMQLLSLIRISNISSTTLLSLDNQENNKSNPDDVNYLPTSVV